MRAYLKDFGDEGEVPSANIAYVLSFGQQSIVVRCHQRNVDVSDIQKKKSRIDWMSFSF